MRIDHSRSWYQRRDRQDARPRNSAPAARPRRRGDRVNRRAFISLLGGAAAVWPLAARAQATKVARIGYLHLAPASARSSQVEALRAGLRNLGYVEGKSIVIEFR